MDCTDIKKMFERDFTEYACYCFYWHNSTWIDLGKYTKIAKNRNHLLREYLSNWDYINENSKLSNIIKNIENDDSGLSKDKKLVREYKSKLIRINAIQFTFNAFSMNVSPFNKSLFKKYKSVRKKKRGERILINDILEDKANSTSTKNIDFMGISVCNAFPSKFYDKVLSLKYILKFPLDKKVNDKVISEVTDWLKWLIFENYDLNDEEEVLYFWVIDYIFKISLVIDISDSYNYILDLLIKDETLDEISKDNFIKVINDNEEYILKQFSKFAQLPFGRIVKHYVHFQTNKLFEDLKLVYLNTVPQRINVSDITDCIFTNFSNEIDIMIDYVKDSYKESDIKVKKEVGFDTTDVLEKILKQIDLVYESIINSHVNNNKIISSIDIRIAIGQLESEVEKELDSVSIIKDQLIKEIKNLKSQILSSIDFGQNEHTATVKLNNIFSKSKNSCCNIIFNMHSMELATGLKEIKNKDYIVDDQLSLKEKVKNHFDISLKSEKSLDKKDVKIFTYLYSYINKWGLFMPII
jgi:hypothetical protein